MKNIAAQIERIEKNLDHLSRGMKRAAPDYLATALYLESSKRPDHVFALLHTGGGKAHRTRADQMVWRRLLSGDESVAAESLQSHKPIIMQSRMFPDEHICNHVPIRHTGGMRGTLQTVFRKRAHFHHPNDHMNAISDRALKSVMPSLSALFTATPDLDKILNVRMPYVPDAVVMFCDISGFTRGGAQSFYRAQDFADQFCRDFVLESAKRHHAELLRVEGDGMWLAFPFDPANKTSKENAIRNATETAQELTGNYDRFTANTDYKFRNTHLKILAEIGELREVTWADDRSGPVFTEMMAALPTMSRHENSIMIGPHLAAAIDPRKAVPSPLTKFTPL